MGISFSGNNALDDLKFFPYKYCNVTVNFISQDSSQLNSENQTKQIYFIGKFSQVLGDGISYRESDPKNRTDDDYEILRLYMDEATEFGIQGGLSLWHGTGEDFDWENLPNDDSGLSIYFFEFQNFLDFYTAPTTDPNKTKLGKH